MTQSRSIVRPNSRIWLLLAFLLIIAGFTLANLSVFLSTRNIQQRNRVIADNAFVSIETVSRIVHDIDQERLLVDAHIFETETPERDRIEKRLSEVEADMVSEAGVYEPLTTFPGERTIWDNLWGEVVRLRRPIQDVLSLSRRNEDLEAIVAMRGIEKDFVAIDENANELIDVNQRAADNAVAEIRDLQRRALIKFGSITVGGTVLALLLAWWVMRIVRRQDEEIARGALLLEENNRELDAFAGRVAHDLRGPLNAISLSASRLSNHVGGEGETFNVLHRAVARMDALIRDLLSLSRIETEVSGAVTLTNRIVLTLQEELAPTVRSVNGTLLIDLEPSTIQGSESLLRQVLLNLGENAVKYRRSEVKLLLDIRGGRRDSCYELQVSDNGTGMSPDEIAHIFEPFYRAAKVRALPGTGLGLSIVKRVVEASGGTIDVASEVDKGTTFMIQLPLAPAEERRAG